LVTVRCVALGACGEALDCSVYVYDLRVKDIVGVAFYTREVR